MWNSNNAKISKCVKITALSIFNWHLKLTLTVIALKMHFVKNILVLPNFPQTPSTPLWPPVLSLKNPKVSVQYRPCGTVLRPKFWYQFNPTCITLRVSACCILLRIARSIWSSWSANWVPARAMRVDTRRPTKAAVNSDVRGSRSWLTTCMTYHRPLWPCSSCHWAICSSATDT